MSYSREWASPSARPADLDVQPVEELRGWAESVGGAMVLTGGPETLYERIDPWGTPPAGLDYQRNGW